MKKYCYLLLCFLFLLGGCGKKETETAKDAQSFGTEEAILSEVPGSTPEEEAIPPEPMSLTDMLEDREIFGIIKRHRDLPSVLEELVDQANQQGGNDNITVIMTEAFGNEVKKC